MYLHWFQNLLQTFNQKNGYSKLSNVQFACGTLRLHTCFMLNLKISLKPFKVSLWKEEEEEIWISLIEKHTFQTIQTAPKQWQRTDTDPVMRASGFQ